MNVQTCFSLSQNAVGGKRGFKGDAPELLLLSLPLQLIVEIKSENPYFHTQPGIPPARSPPAGLIAVDNSRIVLSVFSGPRAVIQMLVSVKHYIWVELVQDLVKHSSPGEGNPLRPPALWPGHGSEIRRSRGISESGASASEPSFSAPPPCTCKCRPACTAGFPPARQCEAPY